MGRLIDADTVVKMIDKHTNDNMTLDNDITCILEDVPTAYDVDNVVEQLEELSLEYAINGNQFQEDGQCSHARDEYRKRDVINKAIDIVEKGGK